MFLQIRSQAKLMVSLRSREDICVLHSQCDCFAFINNNVRFNKPLKPAAHLGSRNKPWFMFIYVRMTLDSIRRGRSKIKMTPPSPYTELVFMTVEITAVFTP